jgi:hypothetical protein
MEKDLPIEIRAFLENLLLEADEFSYGEEIPKSVLWDLYRKLDERISVYLVSRLSVDKLTEYRQFKEKNPVPEQVDVFLMKNIVDYKEVMKKAYKDFYDSYLEESRERRLGKGF